MSNPDTNAFARPKSPSNYARIVSLRYFQCPTTWITAIIIATDMILAIATPVIII